MRTPRSAMQLEVVKAAMRARDIVCAQFGITEGDLLSRARTDHLVMARYLAFALTRAISPRATCAQIAGFFLRDHTTVSHGLRRVEDYLKTQDRTFLRYYTPAFAEICLERAMGEEVPS